MIPLLRVSGILSLAAIPLLLNSCLEDEEQKQIKINSLKRETLEMQEKIRLMDEEAAAVEHVPDVDEKSLALEKDIQVMQLKGKELDDLIDALTIRRDGLKARLEDFRVHHPVD